MKIKPSISLSVAALLALFVTGCESDGGISARTQEKSAAYATLKQWEKNYIAKGVVSTGFTPDMVYMAVGHATTVEPVKTPDGSNGELWTYHNYYPPYDAAHARYAAYDSDTMLQPSKTQSMDIGNTGGTGPMKIPAGQGGLRQSISTTGGPQGGSMEPADLKAFTLQVLFQAGKVTQIGIKPN